MADIDLGDVTVSLAIMPQEAPHQGNRGARSAPRRMQPATFQSVSDAKAHASFDFIEPAGLPSSFELFDAAIIEEPARMAALTYIDKSSAKTLVIMQTALDQDAGGGRFERGSSGGKAAKPAMSAPGDSIVEASVGALKLAVIENSENSKLPGPKTSVAWVKDGIYLQISGEGLNRDSLIEVAGKL